MTTRTGAAGSRAHGARELAGAHVAVIGATGGLGSRLTAQLQRHGARVVAVGRDEHALRELAATGPVVVGDLSDATLGDRLVLAVEQDLEGRLDGLVNAAGVVAFGSVTELPDEVSEELILTNLLGPLWLLHRVVPLLRRSEGFIALVTGVVAEQAYPGMSAYCASKAGLAAASAALAAELRRDGVQVIDLRPPHTETGLAGRPLAGQAPRMPRGQHPDHVAARMVQAILDGESVVRPTQFAHP